MMKDKVVEILGTLYTIHFDVPDGKMPEGADGCMDQSIHQIRIAEFESDRNTIQDMDSYRKKVLRHEIIHAFLYETITDWITIQSPKLFRTFKEADCL